MIFSPIALFTYNRLWHISQTIDALQKNEFAGHSELFIFSDGAKKEEDIPKVRQVREYLKNIKGFKKIELIEREKNWGLADNIIDGVTKIINEYNKIIVLEDDLVTSPYFLKFMNEALEIYSDEESVSQIVGYSYFEKYIDKYNLDENIFIRGADCLGWATWKNRWQLFEKSSLKLLKEIKTRNLIRDFNWDGAYNYFQMLKDEYEGKVNSWAIRWYASMFLRDKYALYPFKSLVLHIGNDGYGTNYTRLNIQNDPFNVPLHLSPITVHKIKPFQQENSRKAYIEFLSQFKQPFYKKIFSKVISIAMKTEIKKLFKTDYKRKAFL